MQVPSKRERISRACRLANEDAREFRKAISTAERCARAAGKKVDKAWRVKYFNDWHQGI